MSFHLQKILESFDNFCHLSIVNSRNREALTSFENSKYRLPFAGCIKQSDLQPNFLPRNEDDVNTSWNVFYHISQHKLFNEHSTMFKLFPNRSPNKEAGDLVLPHCCSLCKTPGTFSVKRIWVTMFLDKFCCRNRGEIHVWAVSSWITLAVFISF